MGKIKETREAYEGAIKSALRDDDVLMREVREDLRLGEFINWKGSPKASKSNNTSLNSSKSESIP